jgi:hypothetical protein
MKTKLILTLATVLKMFLPVDDLHAQPTPYFIAMEYKGLSNCIMKIFITDSLIMGAKVNGYISCQPNFGIGTSISFKHLREPEAYVKKKLDDYDSLLSNQTVFLKRDKYNFIVRRSDVKKIWYDPYHKWGMGYYPDTGKIYIESSITPENKELVRELILIGEQHPRQLLALLNP